MSLRIEEFNLLPGIIVQARELVERVGQLDKLTATCYCAEPSLLASVAVMNMEYAGCVGHAGWRP